MCAPDLRGTPMLRQRFGAAQPLDDYIRTTVANHDLWEAIAKRVAVPDALVERVRALGGHWHLLVLSEDWCGDAVNSVPVIGKLAELAGNVDLRVLGRDANPDLMNSHLTNESRSIPVVIALDDQFVEHGWWGPRPRALQEWVMSTGKTMEKDDRYREVRRWYARDRGLTTLEEIVRLLESAARSTVRASA